MNAGVWWREQVRRAVEAEGRLNDIRHGDPINVNDGERHAFSVVVKDGKVLAAKIDGVEVDRRDHGRRGGGR